VSRFTLRVVGAAGARGNSPAFAMATAGSDSPRAFFRPHRRCSARDNGKYKPKNSNRFPHHRGVVSGTPLYRE